MAKTNAISGRKPSVALGREEAEPDLPMAKDDSEAGNTGPQIQPKMVKSNVEEAGITGWAGSTGGAGKAAGEGSPNSAFWTGRK